MVVFSGEGMSSTGTPDFKFEGTYDKIKKRDTALEQVFDMNNSMKN